MTRSHRVSILVGSALLVGFFLNWISLGLFGGISGFDLVWHGQGEWLSRLALATVPFLGIALISAGLNRSRAAGALSVVVGAGILGYTLIKLAWAVLAGTGVGLWLVLGGAVAAVASGIRAQPKTER